MTNVKVSLAARRRGALATQPTAADKGLSPQPGTVGVLSKHVPVVDLLRANLHLELTTTSPAMII